MVPVQKLGEVKMLTGHMPDLCLSVGHALGLTDLVAGTRPPRTNWAGLKPAATRGVSTYRLLRLTHHEWSAPQVLREEL